MPSTPERRAHIDHLVVAALRLADGVDWCAATLGVAPGPGGAHPLMGTHNRLLSIATPACPRAYLEVIAIDPQADPATRAPGKRWFDLDDPVLMDRIARQGPQLIHWVARVPDIAVCTAALASQGIDPGPVLQASRATPAGLLQWQITVRRDGQRLFDGALPTLIQWGDAHPADTLPASGVALQSLALRHPRAAALQATCGSLGFGQLAVSAGPPGLSARLQTPRGEVELQA